MSEELTPMNHRELWLQAIATGTVPEWLEPMTHEELWLKAIAQGGGSGGGEPLILHITSTPISGGTRFELDKTAGEIYTALMSGKQIFLGVSTSSATELYPLSMIKFDNVGGFVTQLFNKAVINADFNATTATTKPYYTTYGGSND